MKHSSVRRGVRGFALIISVVLALHGVAPLAGSAAPAGTLLEGRLGLIWGDPQPGSGAATTSDALVVTDAGQAWTIDVNASSRAVVDQLAALDGARVQVHARKGARRTLLVDSIAAIGEPGQRAIGDYRLAPVEGHQEWLSILCRFGDATDYTPQPPEYVDALMNGPEPGIDTYWREVSAGRIDVANSTVLGWYNLPQPRSYYITDTDFGPQIEYDRITNDCTEPADALVDFKQFDGINLLFNAELDGYARGGTYVLPWDGGDRAVGLTWLPTWGYQTQYITAHEMGHAFGLPHSSGPYDTPYDSMWDVMSLGGTCNPADAQFGCVGPHTIAYHKDMLGWIDESRIYRAESPEDVTLTVERSALPSDDGGFLLATIPIQASPYRFYTVEARQQVGYDRYVPATAVVIHAVDTRRWERSAQVVDQDNNLDPNDAAATWLPGETFRDALNDVTVSIDAATESGFVITIHAGDAYARTWARTDRPVAEQVTQRTWMWGPESFSGTVQETYWETPGAVRNVRYFDKSRMEITDPDGNPASVWYVTNGLLVVELTTGALQLGDNEFEQRAPAEVNVAGDPDDPDAPTYATFGLLRHEPPPADGAEIIQRVSRAGVVTNDPSLAGRGVTAAQHVVVPGIDHQVASPFWEFMNAWGTVWVDGYANAPLFQDPYYATGLPISEAYWATVRVGGIDREVLTQCFERRCLTYTPENPEGWQVEAGNVGRHYFNWRYAPVELPADLVFKRSDSEDSGIYMLSNGDTQPRPLIDGPGDEESPAVSPDGTQVAYTVYAENGSTLWVADIDGQHARQVVDDVSATSPNWSPDGAQIAFEGQVGSGAFDIWTVDLADGGLTQLTDTGVFERSPAWSPDGSRIVFGRSVDFTYRLFTMTADGADVRQLTTTGDNQIEPAWSPDGSTIVFTEFRDTSELRAIPAGGGTSWLVADNAAYNAEAAWTADGAFIAYIGDGVSTPDVYVVRADGSDRRNVTNSTTYEGSPSWVPVAP